MKHLENPEMVRRLAARFRALSDETRLRLLISLKEGEKNVSTLSSGLGIAQASVSKHLSVLRQAGLVDVRHEGVQSIFFVRDSTIYDMCGIVCEGVQRQLRAEMAALGLAAKPPK